MLLVKSKLRQKLLIYSFSHIDKNYYVRELADLIKEDAANLSKELKKLEKDGLYKSFVKGKIKFYFLNQDCPVFNELSSMVKKTIVADKIGKNLISKRNKKSINQ